MRLINSYWNKIILYVLIIKSEELIKLFMEKYIKLENLGNGANSDVVLVKNLQDKKVRLIKSSYMP